MGIFKSRNYSSEISALSHRLQIPEVDNGIIVQAITDKSFFERSDVGENASFAQPSMEEQVVQTQCNAEMADRGMCSVNVQYDIIVTMLWLKYFF